MSNAERHHWYQFCLLYQGGVGPTYRSVSCGFIDQNVTMARMAFARENAGAPADALISSVSYLGCMTREEFEG